MSHIKRENTLRPILSLVWCPYMTSDSQFSTVWFAKMLWEWKCFLSVASISGAKHSSQQTLGPPWWTCSTTYFKAVLRWWQRIKLVTHIISNTIVIIQWWGQRPKEVAIRKKHHTTQWQGQRVELNFKIRGFSSTIFTPWSNCTWMQNQLFLMRHKSTNQLLLFFSFARPLLQRACTYQRTKMLKQSWFFSLKRCNRLLTTIYNYMKVNYVLPQSNKNEVFFKADYEGTVRFYKVKLLPTF